MVSWFQAMRAVSQDCIMRDDLAIDYRFQVLWKRSK